MAHLFIIGGTTFDHIVSLPEFPRPVPQTIHQTLLNETTGSTGTGKSVCLKKLGVSNTLYSILGNDYYGQKIIRNLEKEGVDFIFDFDPKGTERHINIMNSHGGRISMFITQSSEHLPADKAIIENNVKKSDFIVLNIIAYCKDFIPLIKKHNKPVWTDLHDYTDGNTYHLPFIDAADYIFLSSDNLDNYKQTMQHLMQQGKELVVCTHGKNGATALTKAGDWLEEPSLKNILVADTNGAGDSFFSGFIYAYINGKPLTDCMKYGTICGALCIASQQIVSDLVSPALLEEMFLKYY